MILQPAGQEGHLTQTLPTNRFGKFHFNLVFIFLQKVSDIKIGNVPAQKDKSNLKPSDQS